MRPVEESSHTRDERRLHRVAIWATLAGICGKLERLQASTTACRACDEVRAELARILQRERSAGRAQRR